MRQAGMIAVVALAVAASTPAAQAINCTGPSGTQDDPFVSGSQVKSPQINISCDGPVHRIRVWGSLTYNGSVKDSADVTCPQPQGPNNTTTTCSMRALSGNNPGTTLQGWNFSWQFNFTQ